MISTLRHLALPLSVTVTLSLLTSATLAQTSRPGEAGITIQPPVHDLGDIVQGAPATRTFTLRNESSRPVTYLRVRSDSRVYAVSHEPGDPVTLAPGQSLDVPVSLRSLYLHEVGEEDESGHHLFRASVYWRYEGNPKVRKTRLKMSGHVIPIFDAERLSVTAPKGDYLEETIRLPITSGIEFQPTAVETAQLMLRVLRYEVVPPKHENEPAIFEIRVRTPFGPDVVMRGRDSLRIRGRLPGDEEDREIRYRVQFAFVPRLYATKENLGFAVPRAGTEARGRFDPTREVDVLPANDEIEFLVLSTTIEDDEGRRVLDTFEIEESPVTVNGRKGTRFRIRALVPEDADVPNWRGTLRIYTNDPEVRELQVPLRMFQRRGC